MNADYEVADFVMPVYIKYEGSSESTASCLLPWKLQQVQRA